MLKYLCLIIHLGYQFPEQVFFAGIFYTSTTNGNLKIKIRNLVDFLLGNVELHLRSFVRMSHNPWRLPSRWHIIVYSSGKTKYPVDIQQQKNKKRILCEWKWKLNEIFN